MYILPSGAWKGSKHGAQVSLMFWIDTLVKLVLESKGYQWAVIDPACWEVIFSYFVGHIVGQKPRQIY